MATVSTMWHYLPDPAATGGSGLTHTARPTQLLTRERGRAADGQAAAARKPVLLLRKVRQVLDVFTPDAPELTGREVQRATGLPASTCFRLLQALVEDGFLDRRGDKYRPGLSLLKWARAAEAGLDLVAVAAPVLAALRDATGESACLFLRHGVHHTCVAVEPTPHAVIHILQVGQVLPLHAGSAGRVFLAFDPAATERLDGAALPVLTPHTLCDSDRLHQAVEDTKQDGYAVSFEERSVGAASLSAPVFDRTGSLVAVIGIASPVQRFTRELVPDVASHVTGAAAELSRRLGHDTQGRQGAS